MIVVGYCVLAPSALPRLRYMKQKEAVLRAEVTDLRDQIHLLGLETRLLAGDSSISFKHLEKIARDEFGLIGKDEVLILLDPNTD